MGLFEDFKDENIPGGKGDVHIPDFDQTEPRENREQPQTPREFDQEERDRETPDGGPQEFDQTEPDRANPQFPGDFDQTEPDRANPQTPGSFDQTESDRARPGEPSDFRQEEPGRPEAQGAGEFQQEESERPEPEDPGDFDQEEPGRESPGEPSEFGQTEPDRPEGQDPGSFDQTEPNREAQDPGGFDQEEPNRPSAQDPGGFEQTEENREAQDPGNFEQEEPNRGQGQDPGSFSQEEPGRPEAQDPGSFDQEQPNRQQPEDPQNFSQEEPNRPAAEEPGQFEQTESGRTQPEEPRSFEQEETGRRNPEEPRDFEQTESERTNPEEPSDFDQTEANRTNPEEPRDFEQTQPDRTQPEEPRDFEQEEPDRANPEEPRGFEQEESDRVSPDPPDDFDQTMPETDGGRRRRSPRANDDISDFEQTEGDRLNPEEPRDFDQEESGRLDPEDPQDFEQAESDRFQPIAPRGFEQTLEGRPQGEQNPDFEQEETGRADPEEPRDFEQTEAERFDAGEKDGFEQTESGRLIPEERADFQQEEPDENREQAPELSFDRDGSLAELREQATDRMLRNWKSSKNALGAPFVLTRPDDGSLDVPAGGHTIPGRKLAEHLERQGKFFATPEGVLFNITQGALQTQQGRAETRIYNPAAGLASAAPLTHVNRHLGGLDWEEEIEQRTDGEGYLRQLTNGTDDIQDQIGERYRARLRVLLSSNMAESDPNRFSRIPEGGELLSREITKVQTGGYDVFLGMFGYEGPDGQTRFDAFNPSFPYAATDGEIETADGVPNINRPPEASRLRGQRRYKPLQEVNEDARQAAEENPEQFRLDGETPFRKPEEIPGPRATQGEDPPGPYVSDDEEADKFHENQVGTEGEEFVLHQLPDSDDRTTHGLPNQSLSGLGVDQINALPIEDYDPGAAEEPVLETERGENRQLVDFRIYDRVNRKRLVFRTYLEGFSISHEVDWSSERYSGRPEQYHIYGGANRTVDFSFTAFAESEQAFEAMWNKVNYLEGMVYPAAFAQLGAQGGGAYMVAPFAELTIGNFFRQQPGFIESLDFDINDDYPWETSAGKQLTKGVDVSIGYTVIEEDLPRVGDELIKGDFVTDVNGD